MANTLQDTRSVLNTLEKLIGCVLHIIACGCYGAIFGLEIGHMLLSLSSVAIAFAFVFGNSLRTIYESVVFLFVVHPYSVGDRIIFQGAKHTIDNFGLMMTKMIRFDGSMLWVRALPLYHTAMTPFISQCSSSCRELCARPRKLSSSCT